MVKAILRCETFRSFPQLSTIPLAFYCTYYYSFYNRAKVHGCNKSRQFSI